MEVATGEIEGWSLPANDWGHYESSRDGRWVTATTRDNGYLADRTTGTVFHWNEPTVRLVVAQGNHVLFHAENRLWVAESRLSTVVALPLLPDNPLAVASPDGSALVLVNGRSVYLVQTETGDLRAIGELPPSRAKDERVYLVTARRGQEAIAMLYSGTSGTDWREERLQRYAWDGTQLADMSDPTWGDVSPDGRMIARAEWLDTIGPVVWVMDAKTLEPLFRVRGADLCTERTVSDTFWLSDGSGLVIGTRDGNRLVTLIGELLNPRVFEGTNSFNEIVPAPDNPELFSIGRTTVVHRNGQVLSSAVPYSPGKEALQANSSWVWGYRSDEIRFTLYPSGYGSRCSELTATPRVEKPPFTDSSQR